MTWHVISNTQTIESVNILVQFMQITWVRGKKSVELNLLSTSKNHGKCCIWLQLHLHYILSPQATYGYFCVCITNYIFVSWLWMERVGQVCWILHFQQLTHSTETIGGIHWTPAPNLTRAFLCCILWKIWLWTVMAICRKPTCRSGVGEQYSKVKPGGGGYSGSVRWLFLCSPSLAVFHCCPLVYWRINDLLLALSRQMRPLRCSCIREQQKSCGSRAPLFHFLFISFIILFMKKNSGAFLSFDTEDSTAGLVGV